jgi:hypothetical protein
VAVAAQAGQRVGGGQGLQVAAVEPRAARYVLHVRERRLRAGGHEALRAGVGKTFHEAQAEAQGEGRPEVRGPRPGRDVLSAGC